MAVEDKFKLTDQLMELDIKVGPGGFFPNLDDSNVEENSQDYSSVEEDSQDYSNFEENSLDYSNVEENSLDDSNVEEDTWNSDQGCSNVEENPLDYSNVEEDTWNSDQGCSNVEENPLDYSNVEEDTPTWNSDQGYSNAEENDQNSNKDDINDMILMRMDTFVKTGNHRALKHAVVTALTFNSFFIFVPEIINF